MYRVSLTEQQVLSALWDSKKNMSRTELASLTKLSKATISRTIKQLKDKEFIFESDLIPRNSKGRPHTLLKIDSNKVLIGGLIIRSRVLELSLGNLAGEIKHFRIIEHSKTDVIEKLLSIPQIIRDSFSENISELLAFAIITPGLVDKAKGTVTKSFYSPNESINIKELTSSWSIEPVIENDANAILVSEMLFGEIPERDAVYIDKGFGASFFLNNKIFRGPKGGAGEFGHLQLDQNGPKCWCGKRGCISAYLSPGNLKKSFKKYLPPSFIKTPDGLFLDFLNDFYSEASTGEFKKTFEPLINKLAISISNVVDLLGLDTVVLNNKNPFFRGKTVEYLKKKVKETSMRYSDINLIILESSQDKISRVPIAVSIAKTLGRM